MNKTSNRLMHNPTIHCCRGWLGISGTRRGHRSARIAFALGSLVMMLGGWKMALAQPAQFPPRPPAYQFDPSLNPPPQPSPPYGQSATPQTPPQFPPQFPQQFPQQFPPQLPPQLPPQFPPRYPGGMSDPYATPPAPSMSPQQPWQPPRPSAPQLLPVPPGSPAAPFPGQPAAPFPGQPAVPLPPGGDYRAFERPLMMPNYSWIFIEAAAPREIHVHDIVTIIVKEISESSVDSRFNRQRRGTLLAELREFVRIGETGNLVGAADNEPTIDANLNARINSTGRVTEREMLVYRIAATVVDVLPNGNLVLEARKQIATNGDLWEHTLTGTLRSMDINRDNTCLSENIADLRIAKRLSGRVHDSTHRPWGVRLLDRFFPF
jgi:flagellar L-ring protein precursor FlgH